MKGMYINGRLTAAQSTESMPIYNPASEAVLEQVANGNEADALAAIAAAKTAFKPWRRLPGIDRCQLLHELAGKIEQHSAELAQLLTLEQGKPLSESEAELEWAVGSFRYYAEMARTYRGRLLAPAAESQFNFVLKEPYGVVLCIIPFNFPISLFSWKVAPALAAGNTVIVKPSETTPLSTLRLVELAFDHLPPGVINVVTGEGGRVAEPIVRHADVPLVSFTGSTAVGQQIATLAAQRIKQVHLELGSKDAFVVAPDADIETAVEAVAYAALLNAGQVCTATERVYVPAALFRPFTEGLADFVAGLRLGPGLESGTDIGPMAAAKYRHKVERHVADAVDKGAKILTGGKRPSALPQGYYYEPTVLVDVNHNMLCMRQETFGPTIPVMPYKTFEEAIDLVNDTDYGLGACLRTNDARLAKQFFEEVQAGSIWINDPLTEHYGGPFGGYKMSGNGRELGEEGFLGFLETKHVHWDFDDAVKSFWYPY